MGEPIFSDARCEDPTCGLCYPIKAKISAEHRALLEEFWKHNAPCVIGKLDQEPRRQPVTITLPESQLWFFSASALNPLDAMCHHKDTHSHEWTEPGASTAHTAPHGIDTVRPINHRLGLARG